MSCRLFGVDSTFEIIKKYIMNRLFFLLCFVTISLCSSVSADSGSSPAIIWASSPVAPGETVLLQAGNLSTKAKVQIVRMKDGDAGNVKSNIELIGLKWTDAQVLHQTEYTFKFLIPPTWKKGIYACRIVDGDMTSDPVFLNSPNCWWIQGDLGESSSPEGWVHLAGNSLNFKEGKTTIQLVDQIGKSISLPVDYANQFNVKALLPAKVPTGTYNVWIHNGYGGENSWESCGELVVKKDHPAPSTVFNVKTLGLENALEQVKINKGGILYFPRGEYHVSKTLMIPDNTILRGERKDLVSIYWLDKPEERYSLIYGNKFAIEDLTLYCQNQYNAFIRAEKGEFRMDNVRIRANHMYMLGRAQDGVNFRGRKLNGKEESEATALHLNGLKSFSITNCDILAGTIGMRFWNSTYGVFRNNRVQYGRRAFTCECSNQLIFENNNFEGHDMGATGNDVATFFGNRQENVLFNNNRFANAYGLDRELITFDATGGAYFGHFKTISGKKLLLAKDPLFKRYAPNPTNGVDMAACILKGKGMGQYRRIVKHSGRDWEIDEPWTVDPDETSILSIVPFRGRILITNNRFEDGGTVQLYGMSIENIVSGNTGTRMNGFTAWGGNGRLWGMQPTWYNQILNTEIIEGNNYSHSPASLLITGNVDILNVKERSKPGEELTEGEKIWNHFEIIPQMIPKSLAHCNVIRNNIIHSNGEIRVVNSSDAIIEMNSISKSDRGVRLDMRSENIYLRQNIFKDVDQPIVGEGKHKAIIID